MPYYYSTNLIETAARERVTYTVSTGAAGSSTSAPMLIEASAETGFRTRPPKATSVSEIDKRVADPYSWFADLNEVKKRAAVKNGFDASAFRQDKGHPWSLEKFRFNGKLLDCHFGNTGVNTRIHYVGYPQLVTLAGDSNGFNLPASTGLQSWAAVKYGQTAPTSDRFSAPAFIGELREGLPKLIPALLKGKVSTFKGLGNDYLNVQFGWIPFLRDVQAIATTLYRATNGLFAPWGATHRSRGENPVISTDTSSVPWAGGFVTAGWDPAGFGLPVTQNVSFLGLSGQAIRSSRVERSRWLEAEYVYLPKAGFDPGDHYEKFQTLMKTDLTPSDLWQLSPWSWLVDWFLDIGGAIEAYETATSSRVLSTYAYAMEETTTRKGSLIWGITPDVNRVYTGPRSFAGEWVYHRKLRIRANPFGFTLNPETTLTGVQLAILGALGLTRLRR
jgi:hypothetical protein